MHGSSGRGDTEPKEPTKPNLSIQLKDVEVATVATPQNNGAHRCKRIKTKRQHFGKDDLESAGFMMRMKTLAADEEPPTYSSQGADVGRTRGRKPTKEKEVKGGKRVQAGKQGGRRKNKKNTKKCHPKKKHGVKTKSIGKFKNLHKTHRPKVKGSHANRSLVESEKPCAECEPEECEAEGVPFHHGPKRAVPPHITAHHAYSSAYRKATSQSYGAEYARLCGQMAATLFRETGHVDDLCGVFRNAPRKTKNAPHDNLGAGDA